MTVGGKFAIIRHAQYAANQLAEGSLAVVWRFPLTAQTIAEDALTITAEGATPDIAKPMTGLGSGVWELTIRAKGDAYRVVYALQLAEAIWIVHAFQKKSKSGIATPKHEIEVVRERLKRLKEMLR